VIQYRSMMWKFFEKLVTLSLFKTIGRYHKIQTIINYTNLAEVEASRINLPVSRKLPLLHKKVQMQYL
jgi:hypothetical protein